MGHHCKRQSAQQQHRIAKYAEKVEANHFFNLLTSPQLLETVEAQLPEHRERYYPPTVTLSMFLRQTMSADGSCQNAVNEAVVNQLLSGLPGRSTHPAGGCRSHRAGGGGWRGRQVDLVDGKTVGRTDTEATQACYPQQGQQAPGVGFPLARLVGVMSLATGAVLDVAMGPYQGKSTGEYGLFRRLKESFVEGDVMLADSYFCSYFLNLRSSIS